MKAINFFLWALWRVWFYILMAIPILVLSPFLLIAVSFDATYPVFFIMARFWAKFILYGMGFYYKIEREENMQKGKSYMLVANHTSMTDIMLMLVISKNPFVFVGKAELAKIPIFGFFYKRSCILVDRNNSKSRAEVFRQAQKRLNRGLSICIFPEGGVPEDETVLLDEFKDGAFRLALEHKIPIVPMTFADNKERFSFTFFSGSPGRMRAKVHRFIETEYLNPENRKTLKEKVRTVIYNQLVDFKQK
ncbi:1-acylglycerol-3-phosphate O-acyltransferase [Flavobacterium sp. Sd200]|uniref:lysophospholipid acyltransferase family protein n=1 Tax=Flavobacterium sp. Sd200 TaxID=2692211 RepID=UPI00136AC612|nr:lysophospholipid acyltransferase family protein [Flavobacterium sp. Sd200]MXN92725.1 1-acylglycerol-3-phosphate O-acyltransferase [Flavobacterium sp. Sd200]